MKKMIVVSMIALLAIWISSGVAFSQTASSDVAVLTSQDTVQGVGGPVLSKSPVTAQSGASATGGGGGSGGEASSNATSSTVGDPTAVSVVIIEAAKAQKYNTPVPTTNPVGTPWWMPGADQTMFFNALAGDLRYYARIWTRSEVEVALKENGLSTRKYESYGKSRGFEWHVALRSYGNNPTNRIELKLGQIRVVSPTGQVAMIGDSPEEISKSFEFLGDVPVTGSRGKLQYLALMLGLKLAMDRGADMVILNQGMNTVYLGLNFSPTGGVASAATNISFALVGGLAATQTKGAAEPVIGLALFTKDGKTRIPIGLPLEEKTKQKGPGKGDVREEVNPDMLKSGEEQKKPWYWGVKQSPEVERRAQMSQQEILEISPSFSR